jgi:tetratricopeptide (TPR) repeat protein
MPRPNSQDDEAMEQFNKAMEVDPDSATAYTNKGFLMLHVKQDFDTAKALFEEAIRVDPACIEVCC